MNLSSEFISLIGNQVSPAAAEPGKQKSKAVFDNYDLIVAKSVKTETACFYEVR